MIYANFKDLKYDLLNYFDNSQSKYACSKQSARNYFWISDTERYFDELEAHFEIIVEKNIVSVDLHFENKELNDELYELVAQNLPVYITPKNWQGRAISHIKKFPLNSDIKINDIVDALDELYKYSYPKLIESLKMRFPQKSSAYMEMQNKIDLLLYKKQIILQGPPGTGKTRLAKQIALTIIGDNNEINFNTYLKKGISIPNASGAENYYLLEKVTKKSVELSSEKATKKWSASFNKIQEKLSQLQAGEAPQNKGGDDPYVLAVAKYVFKQLANNSKLLEDNEQFKLIQFHPSYTYEDFVRGIVAESNGDKIEYKNVNKALGLFAEEALKNYSNSKKSPDLISLEKWVEKNYNDFKNSIEKCLVEKGQEVIKEGTKPKIIMVEDNAFRINRYSNENDAILIKDIDIILGYIGEYHSEPIIKIKDNKSLSKSARSGMYYLYQNLVVKFKDYLSSENLQYQPQDELVAEELQNYVLIIDEINRANLSSVLGELIYALEYRGEEVDSMYAVDGSNKLILPPNLYIIGTMNTADRSVGHIDYAIRRRFAFMEVLPEQLEDNAEIYFNITGYSLVAKLFTTSNVSSEFEVQDVQIGHSYFIAKKSEAKNESERDTIFEMKMQYEVLPILEEYVKDGILVGKVGEQPIREYIRSLKK